MDLWAPQQVRKREERGNFLQLPEIKHLVPDRPAHGLVANPISWHSTNSLILRSNPLHYHPAPNATRTTRTFFVRNLDLLHPRVRDLYIVIG